MIKFDVLKDGKKFALTLSYDDGRDDIWYATNIELYEYITAQKSLIISADNKIVRNPTATKVWFSEGQEIFSVNPGETIKL